MGTIDAPQPLKSARAWKWSISTVALALIAVLLIVGATTGAIDRVREHSSGRFGALEAVVRGSLVAQASGAVDLRSWLAGRIDAGNANGNVSPWTQRAVDAVIAAATFILISVEAFGVAIN